MAHEYEDRRNTAEASNAWENRGIEFTETSNTYQLMRALLSYADDYDDRLSETHASQHINTAGGDHLDRIGELVQLGRKSGEPDGKYRARLKVQFRVGSITPTFDNFAEFSAAVLDTSVDDVEFHFPSDKSATVRVSADESVYEDAALTSDEAAEFLARAVPAGHAVEALQSGSFRLKSDGDSDDPSRGLTSDTTSDGGTLAEDAA